MTIKRIILLGAIPGLMLCIFPIQGISFRFCFQVVSIWLAGIIFMTFLSSWWYRGFFALALLQVILMQPVITSYITLMMIAIFLAAAEGFSRLDHEDVMTAICVAGLLLSLWIILQRIGAVPTFSQCNIRAGGPFNINAASVFLALCLPAFFRRKWAWGILPVIVGLMACRSTTGVVAAISAAAIFGFLSRPALKLTLAFALIVVLMAGLFAWKIDPLDRTLENRRWTAWRHTILSFRSAPLGRGLGSYAQIFPLMTLNDRKFNHDGKYAWREAHNEYLQTGFEMGIQTVALEIAWLGCFMGIILTRRKKLTHGARQAAAGIVAIAVSCAGWHTFHVAPLALIGVAWLGVAQSQKVAPDARFGCYKRF